MKASFVADCEATKIIIIFLFSITCVDDHLELHTALVKVSCQQTTPLFYYVRYYLLYTMNKRRVINSATIITIDTLMECLQTTNVND